MLLILFLSTQLKSSYLVCKCFDYFALLLQISCISVVSFIISGIYCESLFLIEDYNSLYVTEIPCKSSVTSVTELPKLA